MSFPVSEFFVLLFEIFPFEEMTALRYHSLFTITKANRFITVRLHTVKITVL